MLSKRTCFFVLLKFNNESVISRSKIASRLNLNSDCLDTFIPPTKFYVFLLFLCFGIFSKQNQVTVTSTSTAIAINSSFVIVIIAYLSEWELLRSLEVLKSKHVLNYISIIIGDKSRDGKVNRNIMSFMINDTND